MTITYLSKNITITTMDKTGKMFNSEFKWVGITEKQATLYRQSGQKDLTAIEKVPTAIKKQSKAVPTAIEK